MTFRHVWGLLLAGGLLLPHACPALCAAEDTKPGGGELIVIDNAGKERKLKQWKFVTGTRHLSWLAEPGQAPQPEVKGKAAVRKAVGPEALEFTEGKTTPLQKPVLTLVPLAHIRSIDFDNDKKTVTLRVAKTADSDEVLHGVTGYVGINMVSVEAPADLGGLGEATLKFQGGVKQGVRSIRFPSPKPLSPLPAGRVAEVIAATAGKGKDKLSAVDLQALYLYPDFSLRTSPTLLFQKTVKLDLSKIQKMTQVGHRTKSGLVFDVTLKEGQQNPLVLIEHLDIAKGKAAFLQGLVGRVEVGYKLFPMQTIEEVRFDGQAKAETPPAK
jgi:hypothetical protein